MKNRYILIVLTAMAFSLFGCKDYLDLVPEKDITTIGSVFEKKSTALRFLNSGYATNNHNQGNMFRDPAMCGADEYMTGTMLRTVPSNFRYDYNYIPALRIADGLNNVNDPILNYWGHRRVEYQDNTVTNRYIGIRMLNIFIENVDDVNDMTDEEKVIYKAEAKAMQAHYYFELIRMYGPVSLVPENSSIEDDISSILTPRMPIDDCFKVVVYLLDESIADLRTLNEQPAGEYGHITKEGAYALKAKALLYQASPLFNGNTWYAGFTNIEGVELFPQTYDPEKWHKAAVAADEAVAFCEEIGKGLYNSVTDEDSDFMNAMRNVQESVTPIAFDSDELLWGCWTDSQGEEYKHKLPRYNPDHGSYQSNIYGDLTPTMRMVELYYTKNGLPLNMDKTWSYNDRYKMGKETDSNYDKIVKLNDDVLNLHLRREPRFYASIAADKCYWKKNNGYILMNPYKDGTHGNTQNRVVDNQFQNRTGYWVKKMIPGNVTGQSLGVYYPHPVLRMAELYLMQAEAWNEYEGPSSKVFDAVDKVRERAGIPDMQDSWNTYSSNPGMIASKEGLRDVLRTEKMIEFAFEGHRFWDLRRWKIAHEYQNKPLKGWFVFGEDSQSFYNNYEGPVVVWTKNSFESPRDYFWPIKDTEIPVANIKQNLGW